ncbi:MAG: TlpA family protein disulfide reductase [Pseudobdellovibrionaceae bacterium]
MPTASVFNKIINVLIFGVLIFVLFQRIPSVIEHWKLESTEAPSFQVSLLNQQFFDFAKYRKPMVLIFWATWCGPCELELARINSLIENGSVAPEDALAIASYEEDEVVRRAVLERKYHFLVGLDTNGKVADMFKVKGTPTIFLLDSSHKIHWVTTGLSPLLSVRIQKFLSSP